MNKPYVLSSQNKPFRDSSVGSIFWKLVVNGKEIKDRKRACINSINFSELCDGSDACTLNITDPDFIFIEDNIFIEEAKIYCEFGFNEDTFRHKFNGYISAIDITFPEDGSPTVTITCLDKSHLMNRTKKERSWDNVTRADVVRKIAKEYGFKTDIEPNYNFSVEETISQSGNTDIEFLESLASQEREPFMCKLVDNTLIYRKKGLLKASKKTLGYKIAPFDVISFSPQITKETRQEEIKKSNIQTGNKTYETYTANNGNVSRDIQGEPVQTSSSPVSNDTSSSGQKNSTPSNGDKRPNNMVYDPVKRQWVKK